MTNFEGRVAVVTGGAGGIGSAVVRTLASKGATVVIADKDGAGADAVAAAVKADGGAAIAVTMDVSDEAQAKKLIADVIDSYGRIDFLDNNAAAIDLTGEDHRLTDLSTDIFRATLEVNVLGPYFLCKYAIPHMVAAGGGSIVNMGSVTGLSGEGVLTAYAVSKAGIIQMSRMIAAQYGKSGVRCNAIAPGLIQTPNVIQNASALVPIYERNNMTTYAGVPQDIADLVAFLASDESRYITGQVICADGGLLAANPILADLR